MVILGIDPGYAIVGYGVIEAKNSRYRPLEHGAVTTKSTQDFNGRLEVIYNSMEAILQKWKPDAVAIEKLFFNSNQKTAIQVAEARGVILLAAQKAGVSISEYTPLQVKQARSRIKRSMSLRINSLSVSFQRRSKFGITPS